MPVPDALVDWFSIATAFSVWKLVSLLKLRTGAENGRLAGEEYTFNLRRGTMAIFKKVYTAVYCDICGERIVAFEDAGKGSGVSIGWAAYFARQKGCTTGKKVICKNCRISRRIEKCGLQKKLGKAGMDGEACLGFRYDLGDELVAQCRRCIAHDSFDWEAESRRLSIDGRRNKQIK